MRSADPGLSVSGSISALDTFGERSSPRRAATQCCRSPARSARPARPRRLLPQAPCNTTPAPSDVSDLISPAVASPMWRHRAGPWVLGLPRTAAGGVHDLHRCGTRRGLHRPPMRHRASLRPQISAQIQSPSAVKLHVSTLHLLGIHDREQSQVIRHNRRTLGIEEPGPTMRSAGPVCRSAAQSPRLTLSMNDIHAGPSKISAEP
jgi:hypothetical protein